MANPRTVSRATAGGGGRLLVRIVVLVLLALASVQLSGPAVALDPKKAITQYMHDVWQTEQGLPLNAIFSICQTRDGYLWLGTGGGLVRFDGVRFTAFPELKDHAITALLEDRQGTLWILAASTSSEKEHLPRSRQRRACRTIGSIRSSRTGKEASGWLPRLA